MGRIVASGAGGVDCAAVTSTAGRGGGCAELANGALLRNELKTRAMRKLKSGGYAEWAVEFQPALVLEPPAMCLWFTWSQRRCDSRGCSMMGATRREQSSEVYFCAVAPSAHWGNVMRIASESVFRAVMSGINQSGACRP
eukprot:6213776-Pleurochrysis_carterae.AAC.1